MVGLISKYYRDFCKENGIKITDRNLAAAILDGDLEPINGDKMTFEKKCSLLKKLAAKTNDSELKALISEILEITENALNDLKNGGKNCIYRASASFLLPSPKDEFCVETFYFCDYNTAYNYVLHNTGGIGVLESFDIERLRIFTGKETPKTQNWTERAFFNSSGELLRIYCLKERAFNKLRTYHATVNPFNDLDIVTHCFGGEIGIVTDPKTDHAGTIPVLFEGGYVLAVNPMCLGKVSGTSEHELRVRAVKLIRDRSNRFSNEKRVILKKTIEKLSGK